MGMRIGMAAGCRRPRQKEQAMPGIVVGVDGSGDSRLALEWAAKEAALQHAPLTVLTVNQVASSHWTGNPVIYPEDAPMAEQARKAAEDAAGQVISAMGDAKPASVTVSAVSGLVARSLIDASRDADLLVVGSRGGGGFGSLVLGSVSSQVVSHAACPVVVVPRRKP
jgi:nucleotide-binding universal stress UspA family protein